MGGSGTDRRGVVVRPKAPTVETEAVGGPSRSVNEDSPTCGREGDRRGMNEESVGFKTSTEGLGRNHR